MIKKILDDFSNFCSQSGWTSRKAAKEVGVSQPHLTNVLNGRRKPSEKLVKIFFNIMLSNSYQNDAKNMLVVKKLK